MHLLMKGHSVRLFWRGAFARIAWPSVAWAIVVGLMTVTQAADGLQGDRELLPKVLKALNDNVDTIKIWQGAAQFDISETRNGIENGTKNRIMFVCDRAANAKRWSWLVVDRYKIENEVRTKIPENASQKDAYDGLIKDGLVFRAENSFREPKIRGVTISEPSGRTLGYRNQVFDPLLYLAGYDFQDQRKAIQSVIDSADKASAASRSVMQDEMQVVYTLKIQQPELDRRTEFDLSKGGTPVLHTSTQPGLEESCRWEYEKVANVWLPKKIDFKRVSGLGTQLQSISFSKQIVNEPQEGEFTFDKIGMRKGDEVYDTRVPPMKRSIYDPANPPK